MPLLLEQQKITQVHLGLMKADIFQAPGKFDLEKKPIPHIGPGPAVIEVRTTICGTDIHIVCGEYPVES